MNKLKILVMCYVGFTTYITIETLYRGYSFALMGFMGAFCFLIIQSINNKISWNLDILLQGCIGSALITLCELIVGLIDQTFLHMNMWSYGEQWLNYRGVICPLFSLIWVFVSIFAVLLADFIDYYLLRNDQVPYYKLFGKTILRFKERTVEK